MKKTLTISVLSLITILCLTNFTDSSIKHFVVTFDGEEPILPSTPFKYADVEFPSHLITRDEEFTGYESAGVDSSAFETVTDAGATLGRVLFYDQKLSALENISCASCHKQEKSFADDIDFSEGVNIPTRRNSMALNDLAWSNAEHFFWDMSHTDLHEMIVLPLTDENEIGANMDDVAQKLGATTYYPDLFEKAYGSDLINEERIVDALVQFIKSMNTFDSKFDKAIDSNFESFNELEIVGLELFSAHCSTCHNQGRHNPFGIAEIFINDGEFENFSALDIFPEIFNNGLEEDEDIGAGEWNESLNHLFKIPTLRNVAYTAPYMHDGRFETLEEVIDHYSEEVIDNSWSGFVIPSGGFRFNQFEKDALVAFMNTLSDENFITDEKWSDPFELLNINEPKDNLNLIVKPNPMFEFAVMEFENEENENVIINLLSSSGQLLRSEKTSSNSFRFNKNNLTNGIYFIELNKGDERTLRKLIIN